MGKEAAEKGRTKIEFGKAWLAGAEARIILLILLARLKPCPCYKAASAGFFCRL
jgi:hypothetical protein